MVDEVMAERLGRETALPAHARRARSGVPGQGGGGVDLGSGQVRGVHGGGPPGHDRGASRLALGVSAAGVLVLAAPVAVLAARRGRVKGSRAGV